MKYNGKATEILEALASSYSQVDVEHLAMVLENIEKRTAAKIYKQLIELSQDPSNSREEIYKAIFEPFGVEVEE